MNHTDTKLAKGVTLRKYPSGMWTLVGPGLKVPTFFPSEDDPLERDAVARRLEASISLIDMGPGTSYDRGLSKRLKTALAKLESGGATSPPAASSASPSARAASAGA